MHIQPLLLSSINSVGPALRSGGTSAPSKPAPTSKPSQPEDELTLSPEAEAAAAEETSGSSGLTELSPEETQQVQELKSRDREVRQHEQAHLAAAGGFALGGPTYTYQNGPDGQQYAIGGEVQIDTSPIEGDPEATIAKARIIRAAALAPAEPSSQDKAVAAAATQLMQSAQQELRERETNSDETEELDGEKLLSSVDVNADPPSSEGSALSSPSQPEAAAKSAVINYFLKEAEQAYSQSSPQSAGSLFLLA
ncbi:putative metalloprotease CJM1_0395 family protein [Blastopirellula retiformator]|uniref:SprA-related family protein n=1 Tax=Blastopirellula retiformator TaxID=2527970 RepID=A0A5C5V935_9BACT|nr:putative metalloprotease CJM1_0395 family protein [Blastopirellula retiformator]TWT34255.1 SprA-related family protein [Blastopirellula retiformator]